VRALSSHMYMVGIIDVYSRYIVVWPLSNSMTDRWWHECLEKAIKRHRTPQIINTDQVTLFFGSEFSAYFSLYFGLN